MKNKLNRIEGHARPPIAAHRHLSIMIMLLIIAVFASEVQTVTAASHTTWYVKASANAGGDGSRNKPFSSLADVEAASAAFDTITVLHAPAGIPALDGGIILKDGQKLIGTGPDVTLAAPRSARAKITNSAGDAITLANDNEVSNLHILDTDRSGIIGIDITGASIHQNLITGYNRSLQLSAELDDRTYTYGGIHLVTDAGGHYDITNNVLKEAESVAIGFILDGTSVSTVVLEGNFISHIGRYLVGNAQDKSPAVILVSNDDSEVVIDILDMEITKLKARGFHEEAIFLLANDQSRLDILIDGLHYHDNGIDPFEIAPGRISDFGQAIQIGNNFESDGTVINAIIQNSTFLAPPGLEGGGFGMIELFNVSEGTLNSTVRNNTIINSSTNGILVLNALGTFEDTVLIENNHIEDVSGRGVMFDTRFSGIANGGKWTIVNNTIANSRFDNIATISRGSVNILVEDNTLSGGYGNFFGDFPSGVDNALNLIMNDNTITDAEFTAIYIGLYTPFVVADLELIGNDVDSANYALIISNEAAEATVSGVVSDNRLSGESYAALFIRNFLGSIDEMNLIIEGNDLLDSGFGLLVLDKEDNSNVVNIDAGGGILGSAGENRIVGNVVDVHIEDFAVTAKMNWWGSSAGPGVIETADGGTIDFTPFLTTDPQ